MNSTHYNLKFSKQYHDIYSKIGTYYNLEDKEIQQIFFRLFDLIKNVYSFEKNPKLQNDYAYVIETLFEFMYNNNHFFDGGFVNKKHYKIRNRILNILLKLYGQNLHFLDFPKIESLIIKMFQEIINRTNTLSINEKQHQFIVQYLEGFFFYSQEDTIIFYNVDYIRESLEEMIIQAGLGAMFIMSE